MGRKRGRKKLELPQPASRHHTLTNTLKTLPDTHSFPFSASSRRVLQSATHLDGGSLSYLPPGGKTSCGKWSKRKCHEGLPLTTCIDEEIPGNPISSSTHRHRLQSSILCSSTPFPSLTSSSSSSSSDTLQEGHRARDVMRHKRVNRTLLLTLSTPLIAFLLVTCILPPVTHVVSASVLRTVNLQDNEGGQESDSYSHLQVDPLINHEGPDLDQAVEGNDILSFFRAVSVPLWLKICFILGLLTLSGLFSGLNLGLMALDQNDLKVIASCGTKKEKAYAAAIAPVRARGNFLLCTLLLGNVLVNTTLTTLLDDVTGSGAIAVLAATLSIVIFGEILPQAVCSRHGLAVGAKTIGITYIFMAITAPLAYPISVALDKLLGEEIGCVYNREQLTEYIRITRDYNRLEDNEYGIITGALALRSKVAGDVMTTLDQVYMLPLESKLTYETVGQINARGFSRIPVYADGDPENMAGVLHTRDLALIDPADGVDLKDVLDYHKHPLIYVFTDTRLDYILQEFKAGKSHMALVRSVQTKPNKRSLKWMRVLGAGGDTQASNNKGNGGETIHTSEEDDDEDEGDPYYRLEGIITLEDIIEEILGSEIVDESDVLAMKLRDRIRESGMYGKKTSTVVNPLLSQYPDFMRDNDSHCDACCKCICGKNKGNKSAIKNRIASDGNLANSSPGRNTPSPSHDTTHTITEGMRRPYRKHPIQRNLSTQSYLPRELYSRDAVATQPSANRASLASSKVSGSDSESLSRDEGRERSKTFVHDMDDTVPEGDFLPLLEGVVTTSSVTVSSNSSNKSANSVSGLPPLPGGFRKSTPATPTATKQEAESLLSNHRLQEVNSQDSS